MPAGRLTALAPCATFEQDGHRCEAYAFATATSRWEGHVTVRRIGDNRTRKRYVLIKGEHDTVDAFVAAAVSEMREDLAARTGKLR